MCEKTKQEQRIEEAIKRLPPVFLGHSDELKKIFNDALKDIKESKECNN